MIVEKLASAYSNLHIVNTKRQLNALIDKYYAINKNRKREAEKQKINEANLLAKLFNLDFKIQLYDRKRKLDVDLGDDDEQEHCKENYVDDPSYVPPPEKKQRTSIETVLREAQKSPLVTSTLDRTKTTNNVMTMIMGSVAKAAKLDIKKTVIGSSTLRTTRKYSKFKVIQRTGLRKT